MSAKPISHSRFGTRLLLLSALALSGSLLHADTGADKQEAKSEKEADDTTAEAIESFRAIENIERQLQIIKAQTELEEAKARQRDISRREKENEQIRELEKKVEQLQQGRRALVEEARAHYSGEIEALRKEIRTFQEVYQNSFTNHIYLLRTSSMGEQRRASFFTPAGEVTASEGDTIDGRFLVRSISSGSVVLFDQVDNGTRVLRPRKEEYARRTIEQAGAERAAIRDLDLTIEAFSPAWKIGEGQTEELRPGAQQIPEDILRELERQQSQQINDTRQLPLPGGQ